MKHTIKLLTLAFTLAAILTLTGCPGPVNTVVPCTHENTRTEVTKKATYEKDGLGKIICVDCGKVIDEQATISWFVAGGHDGNEENAEAYRYQYNGEDDYQIMAYVYSSEDDAKKGENETVLYFSFPKNTTGIPQIVTINTDLAINLDDLIQMKSGYVGKTVKYFAQDNNNLIACINYNSNYEGYPLSLTELKHFSLIYIVIE